MIRFYDLNEAAKILRVHRRTVFHIINRLGWTRGPIGRWRFTDDDILKMRGDRK